MGKEKNNLYVKPRTYCYYNWNLNKLIKELLLVHLNVLKKKKKVKQIKEYHYTEKVSTIIIDQLR